MGYLGEDRRLEYKRAEKIHLEDFATYLSAFSNTPDGGTVVFGANSKGEATGCTSAGQNLINRLQTCHTKMCPQAKPVFKNIPVVIDGAEDFCVAIFIPYVGKLVETNKQEAWIRYGDTRHKMSDEEKKGL